MLTSLEQWWRSLLLFLYRQKLLPWSCHNYFSYKALHSLQSENSTEFVAKAITECMTV
jgi:hypothetical protein